jgi:uncharacterized protein
MTNLAEVARRTDEVAARARAELVCAVHEAAAGGMTQAQIARQVGRSQPEVSRLLRFHGSSALGMRLRRSAGRVRKLVAEAGGVGFESSGRWRRGRMGRIRMWTCCSGWVSR